MTPIRLKESAIQAFPGSTDVCGSRPWTPEPEPYSPETYVIWGQKHFGNDWFELRERMLEERNLCTTHDATYEGRWRALRVMECYRQTGRLPLKGKTWEELWIWARSHYGEHWYSLRNRLNEMYRQGDSTSSLDMDNETWLKLRDCHIAISDIQEEIDGAMLASGNTWHDIMALSKHFCKPMPRRPHLPVESSQVSEVIIDGSATKPQHSTSPAITMPAQNGPDGPETELEWRWELLEWRAINWGWSIEQYDYERLELRAWIRSLRDHEAGLQRYQQRLWLEEMQRNASKPRPMRSFADYGAGIRHLLGYGQEQVDVRDVTVRDRCSQRIGIVSPVPLRLMVNPELLVRVGIDERPHDSGLSSLQHESEQSTPRTSPRQRISLCPRIQRRRGIRPSNKQHADDGVGRSIINESLSIAKRRRQAKDRH